eukprot:821713-Alexandrium_andersonii.AAC.1
MLQTLRTTASGVVSLHRWPSGANRALEPLRRRLAQFPSPDLPLCRGCRRRLGTPPTWHLRHAEVTVR